MSLRNPSGWDPKRLDQDWQANQIIDIAPDTIKVGDRVWSTKYGEGKVKSMTPEHYGSVSGSGLRRYMKVKFHILKNSSNTFKQSFRPIVTVFQYDFLGYEAIPGKGYEEEITLFYKPYIPTPKEVKVKGRMLRFGGGE